MSLDAADAADAIAQLNRRVLLLHSQGNTAEALILAREAYDAACKDLSDTHPASLASLNNLASTLQTTGHYEEALRLFLKSLAIRQAHLGGDHPDVAISLNNLAGLNWAMGDTPQAKMLFERALGIWQAAYGDSHPVVKRCLQSLATLAFERHDYPEAASRLEQARQGESEDTPSALATIQRLALIYHRMGNYGRELPFRVRLVDVARTSSTGSLDLGDCLNNLAAAQYFLGHFSLAAALYREAVEFTLARAPEAKSTLSDRLNNLAALLRSIGDYTQAEEMYRRALALLPRSEEAVTRKEAQTKTNLGELLVAVGRYGEARALYEEALVLWREAADEQQQGFAATLNNLAQLEALERNFDAARALYERALALFRQLHGARHPNVASGLINLGEIHKALGAYALAEPLLVEALSIQCAVYTDTHPAIAQSLGYLAELRAAQGDFSSAMSLIRDSSTIDSQMIGHIFSFGSERQRMAYVATLRARFDIALSLFVQLAPTTRDAAAFALDACLRRKALGAEALAVQRDAALSRYHPQLAVDLHQLTQVRARIAQALLYGPAPGDEDTRQEDIEVWKREQEELEALLARQIPEMNLAERLRTADCLSVADALPQGSALIEFVRWTPYQFDAVRAHTNTVWQTDRYLAFVLPAGLPDHIAFVDLGACAPIDEAIATWGKTVSMTGIVDANTGVAARHLKPSLEISQELTADVDLQNAGTCLRTLVFDPLLTALNGRTRLILAPDGELTRLPFETLPLGPNRYVIDAFALSYVSTGRDTVRFGASSAGHPDVPLVVADPDYDLANVDGENEQHLAYVSGVASDLQRDLREGVSRFTRLPGTRAEGELVGRLLDVTAAVGSDAVKARVQASQSPRILHIGTHGYFLPARTSFSDSPSPHMVEQTSLNERFGRLAALDNPYLRCGLALAGANTWLAGGAPPNEAGNGLLTAEDIAGLDLRDTRLVVLSACDTGLGDIHLDEGVLGLRRAFGEAGAQAVVSSMWNVPDHHTYLLMSRLYQHLLTCESVATALRSAQQEVKRTYPHPYFWGAFVCHGDSDLVLVDAAMPETEF